MTLGRCGVVVSILGRTILEASVRWPIFRASTFILYNVLYIKLSLHTSYDGLIFTCDDLAGGGVR